MRKAKDECDCARKPIKVIKFGKPTERAWKGSICAEDEADIQPQWQWKGGRPSTGLLERWWSGGSMVSHLAKVSKVR